MSSVFIKSESRYPVNRKAIRKRVKEILAEKNLAGEIELSVIVVGNRKMKVLNKQYRGVEEATAVLAFSLEEVCHPELDSGSIHIDSCFRRNDRKFPSLFSSPDDVLRLGDIVISYPQTVQLAIEEEKLVDEKINELVEHGMQKLLGSNF